MAPPPQVSPTPGVMRTQGWADYALLDSGHGRKLERYGRFTVVRPEPQCLWAPALPAETWDKADAAFDPTDEEDAGRWKFRAAPVESWPLAWGDVRFKGEDVLRFSRARLRQARRDMQIVFQDPYSSLNPRMRVGAIVEEPLIIHRVGTKPQRRARVAELFELVGLDPSQLTRYPHQFSGGQRQRIGLARALALNPSLVIADEPVSALDVSVQAQVINLLMDLQERLKLTYLFIAHDLRLVRHICSRIAVMYLGKIVEMGETEAIFAAPAHPYTRALLSAIPVPDPNAGRQRVVLDPASFRREAPLREVSAGHSAAI